MSRQQLSETYSTVKTRFGMNHRQRTALDLSDLYLTVMTIAFQGNWTRVEVILNMIMQEANLPKVYDSLSWDIENIERLVDDFDTRDNEE